MTDPIAVVNAEIERNNLRLQGERFRVVAIDDAARTATILVDGYEASNTIELAAINDALAQRAHRNALDKQTEAP